MSVLSDSVSQFMGTPSRRFFTPVKLAAGTTTQGRYLHMMSLLQEENAIQKMMAETEVSALQQEKAANARAAMASRDKHLDALQRLDPTSDTFDDGIVDLHVAAADDPAIEGALNQKLKERQIYTSQMMGLVQSASMAGVSPEEYRMQQDLARNYILKGDVEGYGKLLYQNGLLAQRREEERKLANMEKNYELQSKHAEAAAQRSEERQERMYKNQREAMLLREGLNHSDRLQQINLPSDIWQIAPDFIKGDIPGRPEELPLVTMRVVADRLLGTNTLDGVHPELAGKFAKIIAGNASQGGDTDHNSLFEQVAADPELSTYVKDLTDGARRATSPEAFVAEFGPQKVKDPKKSTAKVPLAPGEEEAPTDLQEALQVDEDAAYSLFLEDLWNSVDALREFSEEMTRYRQVAPERAAAGIEAHNNKVRKAREEQATSTAAPARGSEAAHKKNTEIWVRNNMKIASP